jgi:hypothetical protein
MFLHRCVVLCLVFEKRVVKLSFSDRINKNIPDLVDKWIDENVPHIKKYLEKSKLHKRFQLNLTIFKL